MVPRKPSHAATVTSAFCPFPQPHARRQRTHSAREADEIPRK